MEQLECKGNETQPRPTKSSPTKGLRKSKGKGLEQLECKGNETQPQPTKSSPTQPQPTMCSPTQPRPTTSSPTQLQPTMPSPTQPQPTTSSPTQPRLKTSSPPRGWQFDRTAEFPWYLQQVVQEESNWRGTWILEVKDMQAMDWGTVRVPNESGRGGKYQRRPTKHLPFTQETQQEHSTVLSDGGQDDLMVWLGKP